MMRAVILGLVVGVALPASLAAQTKARQNFVPRTSDGKPDLTGLWQRVRSPNQRRTTLAMGPNLEDFMREGEKIPPMLPAAEALHNSGWRTSWPTGLPPDACRMVSPTKC